ncbi:FAD-dependent oxidoreductase [Candidatus Roizmanbacteria bacterium]|nr:FAD-dependent oxidoreductase [Candidatus Roizmanbacteria bacterium]
MENLIIIGGGPAGLAAALYTGRANLAPLLFAGSPPGGQLILTTEVENYLGYESILGPELIQKFRSHATKFGTKIIDQNILKVDFSRSPFTVATVDKSYRTKAVIIATGAKALWLGLESETRLRGKGVSACATCDGFFFKNKVVAVVGGGDTALEEALTLTKFVSRIYLIHRRDKFRASIIMQERVKKHPNIHIIYNAEVTGIIGSQKVEGVALKINPSDKTLLNKSKEELEKIAPEMLKMKIQAVGDSIMGQIPIDGLFVAIGHKPDTEVFREQIELDEKGYIVTGQRLAEDYLRGKRQVSSEKLTRIQGAGHHYNFDTDVAGVFAAGDCVDYRYRQAATAVGQGVAAALEVERYLELNK